MTAADPDRKAQHELSGLNHALGMLSSIPIGGPGAHITGTIRYVREIVHFLWMTKPPCGSIACARTFASFQQLELGRKLHLDTCNDLCTGHWHLLLHHDTRLVRTPVPCPTQSCLPDEQNTCDALLHPDDLVPGTPCVSLAIIVRWPRPLMDKVTT